MYRVYTRGAALVFRRSESEPVPTGTAKPRHRFQVITRGRRAFVFNTRLETTSGAQSATQAESVTTTDAQSAVAVFAATAAESASTADTQSAVAVFAGAQAESVATTDAQSAIFTTTGAVSEAGGVADSQDAATQQTFNESVGETLTLVDRFTETSPSAESSGGWPMPPRRKRKQEEPAPVVASIATVDDAEATEAKDAAKAANTAAIARARKESVDTIAREIARQWAIEIQQDERQAQIRQAEEDEELTLLLSLA